MDSINFIIGIITFILTIIGTIIAIRAYLEQKKTKIFFIIKHHLKLYDDLVKNTPGLGITYNGTAIQTNMFILKGVFICRGTKDIVAEDVTKGITVKVQGDNSLWHTSDIIKRTTDLEVTPTISGAELVVNFPLLKDKDFFVLDALGQSDNASLRFNHRISNVSNIEWITVGDDMVTRAKLLSAGIGLILAIWMLSIMLPVFSERSLKPDFYNKNNEIISRYDAVDTLERIIKPSKYLHGQDSTDDIEFQKKLYKDLPITRQTWASEDSTGIIAKKENSTINLILGDTSRHYILSPNYYVRYTLDWRWTDLVLLIPLIGICITGYYFIKFANRYKLYKGVAALANKVLASL